MTYPVILNGEADDRKPVEPASIPPGAFWDYCAKVEALAERERQRMARYCNFCGALTDEGCALCEREKAG